MPGTTLAGVLRHRGLAIANTVCPDRAERLIDGMFGSSERDALTASRLTIDETVLGNTASLVQSRIKIDRFTGGAYGTALFDEEPTFGDGQSRLDLRIRLRDPHSHEVGLLLLLLKDLWTGDLPLGGEQGVGRGRLCGRQATLTWRSQGQTSRSQVTQDGERLDVRSPDHDLQGYVNALTAGGRKEV